MKIEEKSALQKLFLTEPYDAKHYIFVHGKLESPAMHISKYKDDIGYVMIELSLGLIADGKNEEEAKKLLFEIIVENLIFCYQKDAMNSLYKNGLEITDKGAWKNFNVVSKFKAIEAWKSFFDIIIQDDIFKENKQGKIKLDPDNIKKIKSKLDLASLSEVA